MRFLCWVYDDVVVACVALFCVVCRVVWAGSLRGLMRALAFWLVVWLLVWGWIQVVVLRWTLLHIKLVELRFFADCWHAVKFCYGLC